VRLLLKVALCPRCTVRKSGLRRGRQPLGDILYREPQSTRHHCRDSRSFPSADSTGNIKDWKSGTDIEGPFRLRQHTGAAQATRG
jgi:hypothetical protein